MKITEVRITPVSVPVEAPIRYSTGTDTAIHRLVIEIETDAGLSGLGECVAGAALEAKLREAIPQLLGADPFDTERLRWQIGSPAEVKLFGVANHVYAAIEIACLDLQGQAIGRPVYALLGGRVREHIPMVAYLFYRYANAEGQGAVHDPASMVAYARQMVERYGVGTLKFKGGVLPPAEEVEAVLALRAAFPGLHLRVDPNAAWSLSTALRVARRLREADLEYWEDPVWGLRGMARINAMCPELPLASNMAMVTPEDLGPTVMLNALDVVLIDPHFFGGLRQARAMGATLEWLNMDCGMHSQGELGISLAAELHLAAALPALTHAMDTHYHHLVDDILEGGKLPYTQGGMAVPTGPGLGIRLDRDKLAHYHALARQAQTGAQTSVFGDPYAAGRVPVLPRW